LELNNLSRYSLLVCVSVLALLLSIANRGTDDPGESSHSLLGNLVLSRKSPDGPLLLQPLLDLVFGEVSLLGTRVVHGRDEIQPGGV
jgi:hypothetical protein